MSILQIRLLGEFELSIGEQALSPPATAKARSLLAYLATKSGRAHRRELLADLFWPEYPRERALHSLSTALWHIRRALPAGDFILADAQEIRFNPDMACWIDAEALETAVTGQLRSAPDSPGHPPDADVLAAAVRLYRGDFLEGFYDDWCLEQRYYLEGLYLTALEWLVAHHQQRGQAQEALHYAALLLDRDPLREDIYRAVIRLRLQMGHHAEALIQARRCRATLQAELGADPEPQTATLFDQLLGLAWRQAAPVPPPVPRRQHSLLLERPLFVGREAEWRDLRALWDEARSGKGRLVLVSGEAGIGKSRLVEELAQYVRQRGGRVISGRCYEQERPLPHSALADLLRSTLSVGGHSALARLPPWQVNLLAYLAPELAGRQPPSPVPAEQQQAWIFEALTSFSLELARLNALLVILEDLHWASDSMLAWVHHLGRHVAGAPVLAVATYRSEEVNSTHPLHRLAFALEQEGWVTRLELGHLDRQALAEWMAGASEPVITQVYRQTGGNPFFALATLRALSEAGTLRLVNGRWMEAASIAHLPVPDTVRQVIDIHLGRLSAPARDLITVAAVTGQVLNLDLLQAVWGREEEATLEALDELLRRRLVREAASTTGGDYEFDHHLIQEVIYARVHPRRRRRLHQQTAMAMKRLYADRPGAAREIARHFDAAGEAEEALRYFNLAAQEARRLFAWGEAEQYLGRALELLDCLDPECRSPEHQAQLGQVLTDRAELRYFQARLAERDADLAALAALAESRDDDRLRLQTQRLWARYLNLDAKYEGAIAAAEEGLALADRLGDATARSYLLTQIGFARYFLGEPGPALTALESALSMTPDADREARRHITHILGYVHFHLGDYARSVAYLQVSYADHQALGDYNGVAWAGLDIGAVYREMGCLTEAERYLTEHLHLAQHIGARSAEAYGLIQLGSWELCRGHYVTAGEMFRQALSAQQALRTEHGRVAAELGIGLASYHLGDMADARHWLEQAIERARRIQHRRRLMEALIGLGLVEVAAGQLGAARDDLTEAVTVARDSESQANLAAGLAALARAERRLGNLAAACTCAADAVQIAREIAAPVYELWGELELGLARLAQGDVAAALVHSGRAVDLLPQNDESWITTEQVRNVRARILRAASRTQEAEEQARLAAALVAAKAEHIPDPQQRRIYLESPVHDP